MIDALMSSGLMSLTGWSTVLVKMLHFAFIVISSNPISELVKGVATPSKRWVLGIGRRKIKLGNMLDLLEVFIINLDSIVWIL